ncbi:MULTISPECIES: RsmD family RNA methyltransferase [Curtobacterium]|jgi:16S rRNA (guanine966-N2)-methyltransferase|uniref:RsmD family RNA methyltransferase n=1 Tax=Curtobacterium TaxID=2034 RepID=UPI000D967F4E|nr:MULTISPECIES: RsmD family RNA methyltransferase [Curtobacterium]MBB1196900.1 methyltransferase domain-containing protein [Curtobacterium flaccumfaciens]MBF4629457.1 RsmD family RNA methyltransferase [Curtobacterium flaccumfaciens]MBT1683538.1 RsmD family RNA methyltransferase [Curtobacterium flaccumfaciens pv. flaccumfaciens]MCS6546362.1 RsmD family RNA methyltransferase [Curtobacterium flaccumfaciens pv. flaccumfaciens]MCS6553385.1 RsmD family RNA methyltransferase [Curtobacterium flaccumf
MTRIIAGAAGSLTLRVPKSGTRPTSDRVREALFSSLEARGLVEATSVADLYAGTGALGLEAASRGAAEVVLVDRASAAAQACRANAKAVQQRVPGVRIDVQPQPVLGYLRGTVRTFDLVFIDPPYDVTEHELAEVLEALSPKLTPDAVVVVERSKRSPEPTWPAGLAPFSKRSYGETVAWEAVAAG